MVGLMRYCEERKKPVQYKRSLTLLVAEEFLPPTGRPAFDTPINLNGDRTDNHYTNLMWRPLWFARKYTKQFSDDHITCAYPIEDVETREFYKNSMDAATTLGLLDVEIYLSMCNNTYVWPTGQIFRKALDR